MKKIKVVKGNIPTICDHIRKQVLAAGNINLAEKSGDMSTKQIKAAMISGDYFSKRVADAKGYPEVNIIRSIFGGDDQINISKKFGSRFMCYGIISATIIPSDCLIINHFGITIIRKNYYQFVSFVRS